MAIYLSCELFVNAVEWLGQRLNVGQLAVGTVLAAIGTGFTPSTAPEVGRASISGTALGWVATRR